MINSFQAIKKIDFLIFICIIIQIKVRHNSGVDMVIDLLNTPALWIGILIAIVAVFPTGVWRSIKIHNPELDEMRTFAWTQFWGRLDDRRQFDDQLARERQQQRFGSALRLETIRKDAARSKSQCLHHLQETDQLEASLAAERKAHRSTRFALLAQKGWTSRWKKKAQQK